jgi:hypothetical protein
MKASRGPFGPYPIKKKTWSTRIAFLSSRATVEKWQLFLGDCCQMLNSTRYVYLHRVPSLVEARGYVYSLIEPVSSTTPGPGTLRWHWLIHRICARNLTRGMGVRGGHHMNRSWIDFDFFFPQLEPFVVGFYSMTYVTWRLTFFPFFTKNIYCDYLAKFR